MKKTTDYVEDAWKSARQFADPGHQRDYVIGYLRGVIKTMEESNENSGTLRIPRSREQRGMRTVDGSDPPSGVESIRSVRCTDAD